MNHFTAILDYGVGNLKSVTNAMRYLGFDTRITSDPAELERADAIILPGVGAFPDAAEKLRVPGLDKTLLTQAEKKPILGICLGMQLLFDRGEEIRPCAGLGLVHGSVRRLETDRKLPHIGWNRISRRRALVTRCRTSAGTAWPSRTIPLCSVDWTTVYTSISYTPSAAWPTGNPTSLPARSTALPWWRRCPAATSTAASSIRKKAVRPAWSS